MALTFLRIGKVSCCVTTVVVTTIENSSPILLFCQSFIHKIFHCLEACIHFTHVLSNVIAKRKFTPSRDHKAEKMFPFNSRNDSVSHFESNTRLGIRPMIFRIWVPYCSINLYIDEYSFLLTSSSRRW